MDKTNNLLKKIVFIAIVTAALLVATTSAVEAKTYYKFSGHDAVRYNNNELPRDLQKYIKKVEYDVPVGSYDMGAGRIIPKNFGVRLYFTTKGKKAISYNGYNELQKITSFVRDNPEWLGERSYGSVQQEIWQHAAYRGRMKAYLEYNAKDLKWWEQPYKTFM